MTNRLVEIVGLIAAWGLVVAIRVLDTGESEGSLDGLRVPLEVASWLCILVAIIAFARQRRTNSSNAGAPALVLGAALLVLVGAGLWSMISADEGGGNIGLGMVYLAGLALLAVGTVLVLLSRSRSSE